MALTSAKPHVILALASSVVIVGAVYLGISSALTVTIPTAGDWVAREPGLPVDDTLPATAENYELSPSNGEVVTVAHVLVADMPTDLTKQISTRTRKELFIRTVLPLILEVNIRITADRERLLLLKAKHDNGTVISGRDQKWLTKLMREYRIRNFDWANLLHRVDIVPSSLALAQAATESAWGSSRFAQDGNALFGQWTWNDNGMVPKERAEGQSYSVRAFDTPLASVFAYTRNLNTHASYQRFRTMRDEVRNTGRVQSGYQLATTLDQYSERREAYIEELRQIIRVNKLHLFDTAVFEGRIGQLAMRENQPQ